ncbi:hypothetical protein JOQ06_021670 [Pogonophryne albipinna]|uniref:Uncharacterized protein n=1 Tax=Pogonophryne albipinna TaxID=1090488 RepID=A0AAD6ABL2_9TELE|nr:hypothetical protein JOQ06_021670 [Pogonophryne albipinna]
MEAPDSSYSCLVIHLSWKVERDAKMEPPRWSRQSRQRSSSPGGRRPEREGENQKITTTVTKVITPAVPALEACGP